MNDEEEEEYAYSDDEDADDDEGETDGDEAEGGESSLKKRRSESISASANASTTSILREGSDEVRVLTEADLKQLMDAVVDEISGVMSIPAEAATALLRYFSWNSEKLYDQFYADPESVTAKVGIGHVGDEAAQLSGTISCRICCDDVPGNEAFALPCKHYFCTECWTGYLATKVSEGPTCVFTTCPEHKCPQIVSEGVFRARLDDATFAKYEEFSLRSFVNINKKLRFCPGKNCNRVAQAPRSCPCVKCDCGEAFCFGCGDEAHEPVNCLNLNLWKEKCQNDSETANWILANTKRCPKCNTRIEKNQGCNHMTCRECKYEFCWICMGNWTEHGAGSGGYYKCNKYDGKVGGALDDAERAKAELDRYLHYYQRYQGHASGQKFAVAQQEGSTERRMVEMLQEDGTGGAWIDVQFLRAATEQLIECRRVLKYTYVFGYYIDDQDPSMKRQKELFEHHQENLEKFTEKLSELSERTLENMDRAEVINYTRVTGRFLRSLLQAVQDGLGTDDADDADLAATAAATAAGTYGGGSSSSSAKAAA